MRKRVIPLAYKYDMHPSAIWHAIRHQLFPYSRAEDGVLLIEEEDPEFQAWVKRLSKGRQEQSEWRLTDAEEQVYGELALGYASQKEIADALGLKVSTVYFHAKHIYEKLGVRGRIGLQRIYWEREGASQGGNEE